MQTKEAKPMNTVPHILDDKSANKDEFVESTHEVLAEKLYSLIANTPGSGYTIGLEGKWGSGKSTVVEILCEKLEKDKIAFPFYIDAWEHEGDSLRRMFLGSLIQQLLKNKAIKKDCGTELEDIQKKVDSKLSTVTATQTTSLSEFGKFAAALALLIPLGTILVEKSLDEVTFGIGLPIHRRFCFGLALMFAPVLARPFYRFYSWIRDIKSKRNDDNDTRGKKTTFSWFDAKSELQTTNATTEETEKDSVEFAALFGKIMKAVKGKISKLVIIVDNLDRINHHDALKIWSALQTFIHCQREDSEPQKWILVPYTEEGMKALWQEDCEKESDKENISVGKSFLDKNFQLRFEVPDLLIGDWQEFCRTKIQEVFDGFSEKEQATILDVLCWARRNSSDAPSPREIKLYLNQIRLLHDIHSKDKVQLSSICFYATQRYLHGMSRIRLESDLLNGDISSHSLPLDANNVHLVEDLCAILFHVSPEKGIQILLERKIKSCLELGKEAGLKKLFQAHGNAFVGVLGHILSNAPDDTAFSYALAVQNGLASESEQFHDMAFSHWRDGFPNYRRLTLINLSYPLVVQFGSVVRSDSNLAKDTWNFFSPLFRNALVEQNFSPEMWLKHLDEARSAYGVATTVPYTPGMLPMLKKCGELNRRDEKRLASLLELSSDAEDQIANEIGSGNAFDDQLPIAFSVLVDAGLKFVDNTFQALDQHFPSNGNRTDKYFQLIACFDRLQNEELRTRGINQFLHKVAVWDSMVNSRSNYPKNLLAYLIPKYLGSILPSHVASELHIRQEIVTNIVNRWKSTSIPDAESIYQLTSASGDYSYLAMLAEAAENQLVGEVVRCAIRDNDLRIAKGEEVFVRFVRFLKFVSSEDKAALSALFVKAGDIVLEVENAPASILMPELSALQLLTDSISEDDLPRVRSGLENAFTSASREEWSQAFKEPSSVIKLFNKLQNENSTLSLTNAFCEALKQWLSSLFENNGTEDAPPPDGIAPLFRSLAPGFQEEVSVFVNQLARKKSFSLRPFEAGLVLRFGAHDKWTEADGETLCSSIQKAVSNKDKETLPLLIPILNAGLDKFKPSNRFSSTLKEPVETWFKDASEEERKTLATLCSSLHIQLDPPPPSCDNPKP